MSGQIRIQQRDELIGNGPATRCSCWAGGETAMPCVPVTRTVGQGKSNEGLQLQYLTLTDEGEAGMPEQIWFG